MEKHQIIAKAKRKDNGEWIHGYFFSIVSIKNHLLRSEHIRSNLTCHYIHLKKSNDYKIAAFEVIPETLEYHTGYSIDGVDLYTGDLIQDGIDNLIGVIKLGKYCSPFCNNIEECHIGFYVEWLKYDCYLRKDLGYWLSRADIKLIGNIHDNPNLLKEIIE